MSHPFQPVTVNDRAKRAWVAAQEKLRESDPKAVVSPIKLHECRDTFASLMIAAGVNAKALSTYMGHASISITLDRYGHLMPGNENEAAKLLDDYLDRAAGAHSGGADGLNRSVKPKHTHLQNR